MQVARSPLLMKRAPEILQYKWAKKKNTWQKTEVLNSTNSVPRLTLTLLNVIFKDTPIVPYKGADPCDSFEQNFRSGY